MKNIVIGILFYLFSGLFHISNAQTDPTTSDRVIALPDVPIRAKPQHTITTFHGKFIKGTRALIPSQRCVVWLSSPDSTHKYSLNSISIPLRSGFTAGRIQATLYHRGDNQKLLGPPLFSQKPIIFSPDSIIEKKSEIQFDLRSMQLQLPSTGLYVVLDGLPTYDDEKFIKHKSIPRRKAKKDGSTIVDSYILTRRCTDTTTVWTPVEKFPRLRQSPAGYIAYTWMRWAPSLPYSRESAQRFRNKSVQAFDTVVTLEVEPAD
jgi:hypothetical protein